MNRCRYLRLITYIGIVIDNDIIHLFYINQFLSLFYPLHNSQKLLHKDHETASGRLYLSYYQQSQQWLPLLIPSVFKSSLQRQMKCEQSKTDRQGAAGKHHPVRPVKDGHSMSVIVVVPSCEQIIILLLIISF